MKHETYSIKHILVDFRNYTKIEAKARLMIKNFPSFIKKYKPCLNQEVWIEILLIGKKRMQNLNFKYRKIDAPTDVLSFPVQSNRMATDNVEFILGAIVICPQYIIDSGKNLKELAEHGLLHLLGKHHNE